VELLYRQRRYTDADNVLRRFEATQLPITGELGRLAADVSFRVQDFSRAMQIAVQVIGNSESYEDLVWMGQLHSVMNQPQPAEEKLRAAIKKQPKSPEGWIALVQHYVRTDSREKAQAATTALTKSIEKGSVVFVQAICLEALGDSRAAQKQFTAAAQSADADPIVLRVAANFFLSHGRPTQGEPLLRRLLTHPKISKADLTWTRRNLAVIWAATGSEELKQNALSLIDKNLTMNATSAEDRRARAVCLQAIGGDKNCEKALTIVQELIDSRRSTASDFLLAYQLCANLGRSADARRYLEQHTFENSGDPQNLVRYIRFVLEKDELHEASLWIQKLQALCRDGLKARANAEVGAQERQRFHRHFVMSVGLEAYLLWKQDGAKAAISGVTNHVGRGGQAGDPTISFLEAANIFEGVGGQTESSIDASGSDFYSAAESLLRENAKQSRREAIPLIAFLTRRSKLPEAVSIWKSQVDASAADEYAIAAAALAANSKLSSTNLDEIVERVKELRRDQPTKAVLAGLGQLYTFGRTCRCDSHPSRNACQRAGGHGGNEQPGLLPSAEWW
jgi:Tfp pilus assembly protein PilF